MKTTQRGIRMKRIVSAILAVIILCACLSGCNGNSGGNNIESDGQKYNIAVISAGECNDEYNGFFDGIYEVFREIGYSVDKYAADGNKEYLETILNDSLKGGYIGVILYDLSEYAEEYVKKAQEAGVHVTLFNKTDYTHEKVANICYDQESLAGISVDELIKRYREDLGAEKTVVKAWYDETNPVNAKRAKIFDEKMQASGIPVSVNAYEYSLNSKSGLSRNVKSQIYGLSQTGTNYIWVVDDTMALMIAEFLRNESINNAVVINIGVTPKSIKKMFDYETYWPAASVVSYTTTGKLCAQELVKTIEKKPIEKVTFLPAFMLYSSELDENATIEVIDTKASQQM